MNVAALEAWLKRWLMNRSFQAALLGGGLAFAIAICVLSTAANAYFIAVRGTADHIRWGAADAQVRFLKMRDAENRFLLHDLGSANFHDKGESANLDRRAELADAVMKDLAEISGLARGDAQQLIDRLAAAMKAYDDAFRQIAASYSERASMDPAAATGHAPIDAQEHQQLERMEQQAEALDPLFEQVIDGAVHASSRATFAMNLSLVLVSLIALVLAALFLRLFARTVAEPIERLGAAAADIGQGNLHARVDIEANNELGALARNFNRMTEALSTLVGQVQKSGIQVASSVNQIAATSKQQQATASEIAATTMQIGATSREIAATSRDLLNTVGEVSRVAEQSAALAGTGQTGLTHMEETMRQVVEAAGSINAKLAVLNEKAGNISQVIVTITKVADQTNLLSLNAAIEAEKAGEYGRGFSVVATEIRRLADQTAVATYDIEQMVREIQSAVAAGVMGMDKFSEEVRRGMQDIQHVGAQLTQIIHQVQTLAPRFEVVNEGMQAQSTGAEQITQSLTQLNEAAQQTVESLRQSTDAIDGLNEVSGVLRSSVTRFRLGT